MEESLTNMEKFSEEQRHYIELLQDVINRMAGNSANCKTWLLTIVAAVITFTATKDLPKVVLIMLMGVDGLFYILDVFYLYLERKFRLIERKFINQKVPEGVSSDELIYSFGSKNEVSCKEKWSNVGMAIISFSTWPFYGGILAILVVFYCCL